MRSMPNRRSCRFQVLDEFRAAHIGLTASGTRGGKSEAMETGIRVGCSSVPRGFEWRGAHMEPGASDEDDASMGLL